MSLNYQWIVQKIDELSHDGARVLDFGCGVGTLVASISKQLPSLNINGADTFAGTFSRWQDDVPEAAKGLVSKIENGVLPFEDNSFDLIYTNQVFEHVFTPEEALQEIGRVLKPGGTLIMLFPCRGTWFEGHVGVYFAHWFMGKPKRLRRWLDMAHRLGMGYFREDKTREEWVEWGAYTLEESCIYHTWADVTRWLDRSVGSEITALEHQNIAFRLRHSKLKVLAPVANIAPLNLLSILIHRLRGGRAFSVLARSAQ